MNGVHAYAARLWAGLLLPMVLLLLAGAAAAESRTYRYTDEKGSVFITDSYQNIPPQYRKSAEVIREKDLPGTTMEFPAEDRLRPGEDKPVNRFFAWVTTRQGKTVGAGVLAVVLIVVVFRGTYKQTVLRYGLSAAILLALAYYLIGLWMPGLVERFLP
jgi:hypothetical protein